MMAKPRTNPKPCTGCKSCKPATTWPAVWS